MKFHDGTWDFLKMALWVIAGGSLLGWLRYDFGKEFALVALVLCAGTLFFILGSLFNSYNSHKLLELLSQFNAKDAMIDRYRAQSVKEAIKADSFRVKVDAQKELIEYKNQQKHLTQQQKQLPEDSTFWSTNDTVDLEDWS